MDEDVYAEEKRVRTNTLPESTAIRIKNLNKTYPGPRKRLGELTEIYCLLYLPLFNASHHG